MRCFSGGRSSKPQIILYLEASDVPKSRGQIGKLPYDYLGVSAYRAPIPGDSRLEPNLSTACVRYRIRAVFWSLGLSANGRLSWNFSRVFVLSIGGLMTMYASVPCDLMNADLAERCDASLSIGFCEHSTPIQNVVVDHDEIFPKKCTHGTSKPGQQRCMPVEPFPRISSCAEERAVVLPSPQCFARRVTRILLRSRQHQAPGPLGKRVARKTY